MQVHFSARENGPERLVADAEIHFTDGLLAGTKLVGFALWRTPEGDLSVTFPSRAFGSGGERRFFDYLRATDGAPEVIKGVKAWILDAYRRGSERVA